MRYGSQNSGGGIRRNKNNRGGGPRPSGSGGGSGGGRNRVYESNGPEGRVRGTASQVTEKYENLAKDAASAGDYVLAESYYQHAEHYRRIVASFAPEEGAGGGFSDTNTQDSEKTDAHLSSAHSNTSEESDTIHELSAALFGSKHTAACSVALMQG